ncbi:MAG TPA: hypothetical protein VKV74_07850 [Bryobacteraceae bacterium]|nr:hypothetical protein [Bryobacteraceae bacterium]
MVAGYDPRIAGGVEGQLARLDQILAFLADAPRTDAVLSAQEHLQFARSYLLGAMPEEMELSLAMAERAIEGMEDRRMRRQALDLLEEVREARATPMM